MPPIPGSVALILLAAGRSARFGGHKLTASFRGRQLWEWAAIAAEEAGFANRLIVVGPQSPPMSRPGWTAILNDRAAEGIGLSIAAGVAAAKSAARVVIALADMPLVTAGHLRTLAIGQGTVFTEQEDGRAGCPAGFDSDIFPNLSRLDGDRGAGSLRLPGATTIAPSDRAILADVDTRGELARLACKAKENASAEAA